jgi:hypothetical protein
MDDEEEKEGRPPIEYVGDDPAYEDDDDPVPDDDRGDSRWTCDGDDWPLSPELPAPPSD